MFVTPVYARALRVLSYRGWLTSLKTRWARRIISPLRTVSTKAAWGGEDAGATGYGRGTKVLGEGRGQGHWKDGMRGGAAWIEWLNGREALCRKWWDGLEVATVRWTTSRTSFGRATSAPNQTRPGLVGRRPRTVVIAVAGTHRAMLYSAADGMRKGVHWWEWWAVELDQDIYVHKRSAIERRGKRDWPKGIGFSFLISLGTLFIYLCYLLGEVPGLS